MYIDLIGPLPPPHGGISVHLERLHERLQAAGHVARVHEPQRQGEKLWAFFARLRRDARGELLHFHTNGVYDKAGMALLARSGRRVMLTVHGQSLEDQLLAKSVLRRWLVASSLRAIDGVIAVNERIRRVAIEQAGVAAKRVFQIPAFLPPDRAALVAQQPDSEISSFLASHRPVMAANAFNLRDYGGIPLYGADLLPELVARLRAVHPDAGVVLHVAVVEPADERRSESIAQHARALGVAEHLCLVRGSRPFGPTLVRSDAMVRPTVTDGDAVSVREAIWLGIPVVASDCVARPAGVRVAPARDLGALTRAILDALEEGPLVIEGAPHDPFDDLVAVYRRVLAG